MRKTSIDGSALRDMYISAAALLTNMREYVDSLNVFPVPDGDTGTNMFQTINSAVKEMQLSTAYSAGDIAAVVARGALKGARGNSGVILSQILRGFASALEGADEINADLLTDMFSSGAKTAYKAVMRPKEGTILTVIRVIAEELAKTDRSDGDLVRLFSEAIRIGDAILKKTPDMLPVLKQAGVVDSGGMGLLVVLKGMYASLSGEPVEADQPTATVQSFDEFVDDHESLGEITFGYCTEFIVSHPRDGMQQKEVERLRRRLEKIGDCVLVVSDMSVVKVHVHTDDPGKAIQMGLELGELDNMKIDNMREEAREREARKAAEAAKQAAEEKEYGIVSVSLGDGFTELFGEVGVDCIVDGGQTMNPSIDDLLKAIESTHARNVFVLPNNTNIILAAQQAAELTERNVVVLNTKSVPMGISAAVAFTEEASVEENAEAMDEAAQNVHTGAITYSVRDSNYEDNSIHTGDIMGLIDNKISVTGGNIAEVAFDTAEKMVNDETSLITLYYGSDVDEETAQELCAKLEEAHPDCDVSCQNGGQPLYYYYIAVE